ncbi:GntR family transcriptional regulator [Gordonia sp. DT219]|uniref:GntR family transcriptional regulator n=1 Tax=Gordonia sp. DT219 TaxID=3416658 RepID=UPI003CEA5C78
MALPDTRGHFISLGDDETDEVYLKVYESVLSHQLQPGTKLPEEKLAEIFGVTRSKIRKVLTRLEHEQIVAIIHNRGAFVAQPSIDQASDTLEARRVIEPAIARMLAEKATKDDIRALRKHVEAEYAAHDADDKPTIIRLVGEFHNLAAELAGNAAMTRTLRELTALTCLTILLYEAPTASSCLPDDHVLLTDAIERRDPDVAAEIMVRHLKDVESSLVFDKPQTDVDLAAIFR